MLSRLLASTVISVLFISTAQAQTQPPIEETMQEFVAQPLPGHRVAQKYCREILDTD
ncbi:MAG: hypothetical protein HRT36_02510 [Alphaproteobacteria bacterium]|nr:hypothetical protein [Alphaproteobacteria bacterium]